MPTVDEHAHCKICGRTCPVDDLTCSDACEQKRDALVRTKRNYTYLLYASMALIFVVLVSHYIV